MLPAHAQTSSESAPPSSEEDPPSSEEDQVPATCDEISARVYTIVPRIGEVGDTSRIEVIVRTETASADLSTVRLVICGPNATFLGPCNQLASFNPPAQQTGENEHRFNWKVDTDSTSPYDWQVGVYTL